MLNLTRSVNLNGYSNVETTDSNNNKITQQVVYFSANITENGNPSVTVSIINKDLYSANKAAVQSDIASFYTTVYTELDAVGGNTNGTK
ncbi:hypothetical protein BJV85_002115 [Clostridium acetobutylicum]|uniref:Uncharacterized protein n=1 Tax=Clostridium acetobutylicum (strain ATCC 824 / DSM 792 / JCM 1419 / IAM 19013 / LMG 5710 / NBRC 13948 / NRRL B-527 / VKM B-1787 / 2291 / W) TaxID=272562 RepID=Q97HX5_CLOAB|nr:MULTISPECIES: hypothetical protein [Clostridium]AAK79845.1 Hypothetical protein CA_C1881 [Clostridium acetobutylicum ATCC 824]ADZ20931.1 Conserved hypothetical protein [Clostridium acetobutylicum EA 2018]AEI32022.1 hypothetical protein SMB_G1906 [Clostridium acetobutylicum DSM 1731]AWV79725.1 hypothetical protein DK921_06355 [Clostridium acetobutylicum]MBC2394297.1 hypothetical protein [Clostridium acetobutylicum]